MSSRFQSLYSKIYVQAQSFFSFFFFKCVFILINENCRFTAQQVFFYSAALHRFIRVFLTRAAVLQFELGLFGLHGFGGNLGALRQQRCLLSWSL